MKPVLFAIFVFSLGALVTGESKQGDDIVVVLDSSKRMGSDNFELVKNWLITFVRKFSIGPKYNQFSFISYGGGVHVEQILGQSTSLSRVQSAISQMTFYGGTSIAGEAIRHATENAFSDLIGGRQDRFQVIVHIGAGGDSEKPGYYVSEVQNAAQNESKIVFNVALGNGWKDALLAKSSSFPPSHYVIQVASAKDLDDFTTDTLVHRIFEEPYAPPTKPTPASVCSNKKVDIIFAITGASSMSPENFQTMKSNLKDEISNLPINEDGIQVGILQFSDVAEIEIPLNKHLNSSDLVAALDKVKQLHGETRMDVALRSLIMMVTGPFGSREEAQRIVILITDGKNHDFGDLRLPAFTLYATDTVTYAIGIGQGVADSQLDAITFDKSRKYLIKDTAQLSSTLKKVLTDACKVIPTTAPVTGTPGNTTMLPTTVTTDASLTKALDGKCVYKSKVYQTGESWVDGCDYVCTCVNGTKGQYECFNRCPLYYDLPKDCTLIRKEGDCCLRPVCNFHKFVQDYSASSTLVDENGVHICRLYGKNYYQNELLTVGCKDRCKCFHARSGLFRCTNLCPSYPEVLPPTCQLVPEEGACCKRLVCTFFTVVGKITGQSNATGNGENYDVDDLLCRDKIDDCSKYGKAACTGSNDDVRKNCPAYCDLCQKKFDNGGCLFNNTRYKQGEEWSPDCRTICTCDNQYTGNIRCFSKCPTYDGFRGVCRTVQKPGECCPYFDCSDGRVTNIYPSTTNLLTQGTGQGVYRKDKLGNLTPIFPSFTPSGDLKNPDFWPKPINGCLFQESVLVGREMGIGDNCGIDCTCFNEAIGEMACTERCPTYEEKPECEMIPSPRDSCCRIPRCPTSVPTPHPNYAAAVRFFRPVTPPYPKSLFHKKPTA